MAPSVPAGRRRRDIKTEDREKSMSPLDKDALKQRCLERLRRERRCLMARNRAKDSSHVLDLMDSAAFELKTSGDDEMHKSFLPLSTPREILRHGLKDISESRRCGTRTRRSPQRKSHVGDTKSGIPQRDSNGQPDSPVGERSCSQSRLSAPAKLGDGIVLSICIRAKDQGIERGVRREALAMEGEEGYVGDGEDWDKEHLLSPEEYEEMMRYIEEACKEEDLRAEAEILEEYELNKRLEEEALHAIISSNLQLEGPHQDQMVLCPMCKHDYLVQAGSPSRAVVCVCGFRLNLREDHLDLEHFRQQLAETYEQHRTGCYAEPDFSLEGTAGLSVLWSSCDGCGFTRVVI